jgi:N-acyl-D-aspartate/D-glutamate deacylase
VRGVEWVLVNGTVVVEDGEHTGALAGRHLPRA